jgi:plastocyanin domain-containing protein
VLRSTWAFIGVLACAYGCGGKAASEQKSAGGEIVMSVTANGFEPDQLTVKRGEPVKLLITRKTDETCAKEILVDEYGVRAELPLNVPVRVGFTPTKGGTLRYGCAMDKMVGGVLTVQ